MFPQINGLLSHLAVYLRPDLIFGLPKYDLIVAIFVQPLVQLRTTALCRSIRRIFGAVRAVINLTIQEQGLGCANGFSKTYLPDEEAETRQPIPTDELIIIQNKCLEIADERRLLIALISDLEYVSCCYCLRHVLIGALVGN